MICSLLLAIGAFSAQITVLGDIQVGRNSGIYSFRDGTRFAILRPEDLNKMLILDRSGSKIAESPIGGDVFPVGLSKSGNLVFSQYQPYLTKPDVNEDDARLRPIVGITEHWCLEWQNKYFASSQGVRCSFAAPSGKSVGYSICDSAGKAAFYSGLDPGQLLIVDLKNGNRKKQRLDLSPGSRYCRPELHFSDPTHIYYFSDAQDVPAKSLEGLFLLRERPLKEFEEFFDRVLVRLEVTTGKSTCLLRVQSCGLDPKGAVEHDLSPKLAGHDLAIGRSTIAIRARTRIWIISLK